MLNMVQTITPMVQQYGPLIKSVPSMMRLFANLNNQTQQTKQLKQQAKQTKQHAQRARQRQSNNP